MVTSLAEVWIEILYLLTNQCSILSLPLRKCGLKYGFLCIQWSNEQVTSLAEVWIEIGFGIIRTRAFAVTSLAEVWIEISSSVAVQSMSWPSLPLRKCGLKSEAVLKVAGYKESLPLRKCGLKSHSWGDGETMRGHFPCGSVDWNTVLPSMATMQEVTSLAEVWIEICNENPLILVTRGHFPCGSVDWNHLYQRMPLQHMVTSLAEVWIEMIVNAAFPFGQFVTSLAEVWIEITEDCRNQQQAGVTSLAEVWIEICTCLMVCQQIQSHFPCGSVDWNRISHWDLDLSGSHFPCGSVDWNMSFPFRISFPFCHFPCGSVDWNAAGGDTAKAAFSHFPCGSVDWNRGANVQMQYNGVTSLAEVWIEIIRRCRNITDWIVTSLAEVWIEMSFWDYFVWGNESLPLRKCGLKYI